MQVEQINTTIDELKHAGADEKLAESEEELFIPEIEMPYQSPSGRSTERDQLEMEVLHGFGRTLRHYPGSQNHEAVTRVLSEEFLL